MKDPLSVFIEESADYVRRDYYKLMFRTKKLFFQSLIEGKDVNYFKEQNEKIWGKVDHSYMKDRMKELEVMVAENNAKGHKVINPSAKFEEVFKIDSNDFYASVENKYAKDISRYYTNRFNTLEQGFVDKQSYLTDLVEKYDNYQASVPYHNKDGTIRSYHNIADYNSMVYNTNLNKSGWNRTYYDADLLGNDLVYLPAHPFACPLCIEWQGKVYSISGKSKKYPPQEQAINGGIGHPHCKHQWTLYWDESQVQSNDFNSAEWRDKYDTRSKVRGLELKRTKLKTDMAIYENIGNYEEVEKNKSKIRLINSNLKTLREGL